MHPQPQTAPRAMRVVGALLALTLVLVACGDDDADGEEAVNTTTESVAEGVATTDAPPASSAPATGQEDQSGDGTRTVSTPEGDVEVPAVPERIVALDPYATLQTLDDLGAPLVAAGSLADNAREFVSEETAALPSIGIGTELNYEALAAAKPDLIIGLASYGEDYATLSEIAPTVLVELGDWSDIIRSVADAAGLGDAADKAITDIDRRVEDLAAELADTPGAPTSISVLRVRSGGEIRAYTSRWRNLAASALLADLGLEMTGDRLTDKDESYVEVSSELLGEIDADVIVYYGGGGVLDDDEAIESLEAEPLWQQIPAVADGRAHQVDANLWFSAAGPTAVGQLLDDIERILLDR